MNWQSFQTVLDLVWNALNSPVGIAAVAGVVLWLLNRLYAKKPDWKKFEGSIIAAVKLAEKSIPDDTPNKAAARLDAALRYVLTVHHEVENRIATAQEVAALREGIQIVHAELEAKDGLVTAAKTALILLMVGVLAVGVCGCTVVSVAPGAGPVSVGATSAIVATEGQETDNAQTNEKPGPTTQPVLLETLSHVDLSD